jgi:hypothetical protein
MVDEKNSVNDPFDQMVFTYDRCFLCGNLLNELNSSVEHIFPKWLQNKFALWNKELILLNGTSIKYKNLKIPCCKECNSIMGRNIEKPLEQGVSFGYEEFMKLNKMIIFQWLNKIAYGMLFKELSLKAQLSDPKSDMIYNEEHFKKHKMQHLFLRSIIYATGLINNPWSILIFRIDPNGEDRYWAHDNPFIKTFFIRMNDIGVISHLMDNGYNEGYFMEFDSMRGLLSRTLHPIQFAELCAQFLYKSFLFYREPYYTILFDENRNPKTIISHALSGDAFSEWNQEEYSHCLSSFLKEWGVTFEDIFKGDDLVMTYLKNDDGTFKQLVAD